MKSKLFFVFLLLFCATISAKDTKRGFAIVIDSMSYNEARNEVKRYAESVEADGLKTFIVVDRWHNPDGIRQELKRLYESKSNPIEGAVFIGDIPIPMLRDAQHLTSAFKMDQRRNWQQSSIASDHFYDDFDLSFDFLKQDSIKTLYFYYSLRSDSKQALHSDIYTARIRPLEKADKGKYEQLRNYLAKVVAVKLQEKNNVVDNLTVARGYGYNSESKVAWAGEHLALKEQFPSLFNVKSNVKFMDFDMYWPMKPYWMNEILRPELDVMLFHHHGSNDIQYVSGYKSGSDVNTSIENIKLFLRSKVAGAVKRGQTKEEAVESYAKSLGVPREWCEEAFDSTLIAKDSVTNALLEITPSDILSVSPNARFVMFDACFNGSFYEDEYIAGAYIFNDGKTIVTQGNTVNTIQDKWPDEFLGLLSHGIRVGQWGKYTHFLETHIFGDPTFRFAKSGTSDFDINDALVDRRNDVAFWKKALSNPSVDIQAIALRMLYESNYVGISALLKKTYFESSSMIVRLEALMLLSQIDNDDFVEVLAAASADSYELTKRYAADLMTQNGSDKLLPAIAKMILNDNTSKRLMFKLTSGLRMIDLDKLEKELITQAEGRQFYSRSMLDDVLRNITSTKERRTRDFAIIPNKSEELKNRISEISRFRNNPVSDQADLLLTVLADTSDDSRLRKTTAEALGWFNYSYRKNYIIGKLQSLVLTEKDGEVLSEMNKSINRLSAK